MHCVSVMTQDCTMMEDSYIEAADTSASCPPPTGQEGSKLPPVLANLMVSLNSNRSPQAQSNAPAQSSNPAMNVQELLSSIMVRFPARNPQCLSSHSLTILSSVVQLIISLFVCF